MFIPLHVKSDYSLGYGTASVDELVGRATALGYRTLALTDLENLYGQMRFHHQCRLQGIRPITGVELRTGFDSRGNVGIRAGRVILLAADNSGYGSLCRIISLRRGAAHERGMGDDPLRNPLPLIRLHPDGLFVMSDDPAMVEQLLRSGAFLPERVGLLLVRPDDLHHQKICLETAQRLGVRLVADLDCVFLGPRDHSLHVLQLAIKQGRHFSQTVRSNEVESNQRWLRSPEEASELFADIPEALGAASEIADACRFDFTALENTSPSFGFGGDDSTERLHALCKEAIPELYRNTNVWTRNHSTRLAGELATFRSLGFSDFLLVVAEILAHCRQHAIPIAVRGSAVSSLALHLLGGSPVDPITYGLLFERFLHGAKSSWPDVDIDLPWHRRDEVLRWVYERFGHERVAMVAAHHTFQYRSALREGLKAWGVRPAFMEAVNRALPPDDLAVEDVDFLGLGAAVREQDQLSDIQVNWFRESAELNEILPLCRRLVGRPHHISTHPGGIVVGQRSLEGLLPLERAPKGVIITQYDLVAVARLGLVKIDLLGNRCLSELEEALALSGHNAPTLGSIPADDSRTLALVDRAETIGCFQLESPAMRSLLKRLPIRNQSDIIAALALIRPGAASGEVKTAFVRRARKEERGTSSFPGMADRLKETHGLFLYEEDIMLLLSRTGGITLEDADELRSAIVESGGDQAVLSMLEKEFLKKASLNTDATEAQQAWATATRFAAYSFNKAHAASYGMLAYFSAYVKAHHPLQWACALLNHHQGLYPLRTLGDEIARMKVVLQGPHVNFSGFNSLCEAVPGSTGKTVRIGLDKIEGLSFRTAQNLLDERINNGIYTNLRNLLERVSLNSREASALVLSGACDGLSPLSTANYPFAHEAVLGRLQNECDLHELDNLQFPQLASVAAAGSRLKLYQSLVRVKNELRYLGIHLLAHPMALLRPEAKRFDCRTVIAAAAAPAGSSLRIAAVIAAMRRINTDHGPMQFLTLEDETGLLEAALLPPVYRRLGEQITTPGPFIVEGKLRKQDGASHLEINTIYPFHKRRRPFAQ